MPVPDTRDKNFYGIFNDSFPPILDGVTLTVENYVRWLGAKGMKPCVVTPWNPISVEAPCPVIRYFSLPIASRHPYRYGYPKLDPMVWSKLRHTPFNIVHAHCPFSSGRLGIYVKRKQNVPLIGTFHSKYRTDLEHSFRHMPWLVPVIMKRIISFFNACDHVWIPQSYVSDTVREYGYKGTLTVVENGNDFADFPGDNVAAYKSAARKKLGIANDELSLLFVGQHIWEKGIGVIADALKLLPSDVRWVMNFIGTGYASADLKAKLEELGISSRCTLRGVIDDRQSLATHYAAADIFLFPSRYDNAPLVIREAAAFATPAVLVRGSTAAEVVRDGENGFLADRTPADYAALLTSLYHDRKRIASAGDGARRTLVRSWHDVVDEVALRYADIIDTHRRCKP